MSAQLVVQFDSPRAGWLPLVVNSNAVGISLCPSDVPNDFIAELVSALCGVATTQGRWSAMANEEPRKVVFSFSRTGGHVQVRIKRRKRKPDGEPFNFAGSVSEVILPFWRALRRLQHDDAFSSQWKRPFPLERMNRLTELATTIKTDAG